MRTTDDLNYVQKLAIIYGEIIKSRAVITSTIEKLKLDMTYEELVEAVSVSNVSDTLIMLAQKKLLIENDGGLLWNDPEVGIKWPLEGIDEIILSEKDKKQPTLK